MDAPIRAVVILSQGERDRARPASPGEALRALLSGCTVDRADPAQMDLLLNAAEGVAATVPFIALRCLPAESAVACLRQALPLA